MSDTKLIFLGSKESKTTGHKLELFANDKNNIYIFISVEGAEYESFICLNKETAIKLSKTLKTEISKLR